MKKMVDTINAANKHRRALFMRYPLLWKYIETVHGVKNKSKLVMISNGETLNLSKFGQQ
jgi:hypothetical protein